MGPGRCERVATLTPVRTPSEVVLAASTPGPLGGADCEQVRDGFLAQPVASLSSLTYVVAGALLAWWWRDVPHGQRGAAFGYAGLLALTGLGSVAYHGPQPPGAGAMHDLPIIALLALAAGVGVTRAVRGEPVLRTGARRYVVLAIVAVPVAAAAYWAGRTGSPLCDPESLAQPHGVWHAASALVMAAWGAALWPRRSAGNG